MPEVEEIKRYQLFMTMMQMGVQTMGTGPNGVATEITRPMTFPVSIRWEIQDWTQGDKELDRVNAMYQVTTQLAIGMSLAKFIDHLFKVIKELFPGRRFMVSIGSYIMENKISEQGIMPLNLIGKPLDPGKEE